MATFLTVTASFADTDELDALLSGLKTADMEAGLQIEQRLYQIWSQSGSAAMDLLLERGRDALRAGDTTTAIEHLTALIDHAPAFAEGYNARATAYFEAGLLGPSLEDIRRTLHLNPNHFAAMQGLALILEEVGQPEAALDAWREVEKIYPAREGLADAIARLERDVEGRTL